MDFLERFRRYIKHQNLPIFDGPILLAVSGGIDSMVMLHLFSTLDLPFGVAHCHFQLRGQASDEDAAFVEQRTAELGIPFFVKRFETKAYAEKNGISTQMSARILRYEWFAEMATAHGFSGIATAHHLNDSIETVLLNFIRGTGIAGMTGIRNAECGVWSAECGVGSEHLEPGMDEHTSGQIGSPLRTPNSEFRIPIFRPLLFATRDEILAYAMDNGISWREDNSNASDDYARNFLRHHIVPQMETMNPNFLRTAERNLVRFQETKDNLDFLTRQFLGLDGTDANQYINSYSIGKHKLTQLPAPRRALQAVLKPHGFTEEQARQLAENLDHVGFQLQSLAGWHVLCDRTEIIIRHLLPVDPTENDTSHTPHSALPIEAGDLMVRLPDETALFFMEHNAFSEPPDGKQAIVVDRAKIQFPLTVRHWEAGDTFQPFGMAGQHQKLQDFFTNHKLSRIEKEQMWLLVNGDGAIIWVVGMRLDERFRIDDTASNGIKISWF